jgi:hypothetical protein
MIQDKIFFDEKDPTGLSYNTPFTVYGSYEGRLWSKTPSGTIKYYTQNSDLSVYATTGSNSFNGNQTVTGSLTVTEGITGTATTASYVEYAGVANKPTLVSGSEQVSFNGIVDKPTLVSGSSQITYSGISSIPAGIVSSSAQVGGYGIFATTGSNQFNGSQAITGSLTVTGQVVAQTLNVQQVTSSIVFSSGSNIFGNSLSNTQQFTGSVSVTGSLTVTTAGTELQVTSTGVNLGNISTDNHNIIGNLRITGSMVVTGSGTFTSNVAATGGTFINGSNQNTLGSGALSLINFSGYNSSAAQSITLGLALDSAVDNNRAYQYVLNAGGNAAGQDLNLTSKRRIASDLTILNINGTSGAVNFVSSVTATSFNLGNGQFLRLTRSSGALQYDALGIVAGTDNTRLISTGDFDIVNGSLTSQFKVASTGAATFVSSVTARDLFNLRGDSAVNNSQSVITFTNLRSGTWNTAQIEAETGGQVWAGNLVFRTASTDFANVLTERMRITSGGLVRIANFTSNGLVGTDAAGNLGVVNNTYTEIATGTISYSMTAGSPWAINNSFPATIRDFNDDAMAGSGDDSTGSNQNRGVTFDLGSAKAVRKIVERGYSTKNLNQIIVQYSTDNSNWTDIHVYRHVYGNTQKNMEFNPTGAIAARYWRWFIDSWTTREVQNYYTYESIIYT